MNPSDQVNQSASTTTTSSTSQRVNKKRQINEAEERTNEVSVEMFCNQAIIEAMEGIQVGRGIPDSAQRAFTEAKKISPDHPRVQKINDILTRQSIALLKFEYVQMLILEAKQLAKQSIDEGNGMPEAAMQNFLRAKHMDPSSPFIFAFQEYFQSYFPDIQTSSS